MRRKFAQPSQNAFSMPIAFRSALSVSSHSMRNFGKYTSAFVWCSAAMIASHFGLVERLDECVDVGPRGRQDRRHRERGAAVGEVDRLHAIHRRDGKLFARRRCIILAEYDPPRSVAKGALRVCAGSNCDRQLPLK